MIGAIGIVVASLALICCASLHYRLDAAEDRIVELERRLLRERRAA